MRNSLALSVLALVLAAPTALIACSGNEDSTASNDSFATASETKDETTDETEAGGEGTPCWDAAACAEGLVCKNRPSGPPPGAVGMPLPSSSSSGHSMPPGAVGMPLPPKTCQLPAAGEEGSRCRATSDCDDGLVCSFDSGSGSSSGGMPPGAVGMPVPASSAHSFPPGAVGMPIFHYGTCAKNEASSSSGGPPPGAVGMPIHP